MGSQNPTGSDRSRTYWTPTMERYFIDLMLEQLHRGSRIGHTFNKQAWTDMLTMFNAKFGSQYDKDVLKSRYTNLWKIFNDVKNLLGQSGFSWDETRQMVVADDYVWNDYIKAHPDARSYKTKAVLNFNDLCVIYGYTTADGRYSRSSHDLDFDDEVQGANIGDGMGSLTPSNNERLRTDWTAAMDQYFIELMLDQVGRGNKTDSSFNRQSWTDMLALFNAKFGSQHGKRVLRHRHKKLWKYYSDMTVILKQEGFHWAETQQMILAGDDVWDTYIKGHPHARAYRKKTLPNYTDLILIFGNAFDNGISNHLHEEKDREEDNSGMKTGYPDGKVVEFVGEGKGSHKAAGTCNDRTRTYWTPPMDRYLIDLLLDQVHRGNKLGQTFISQAWIDMVASFNANFQSHHDKDVLKNRFKHLRRQYNDIKILLEHGGFVWNEAREMVTAKDHVWDAYIKEHPDARSYRVKTLPSYHKLCAIFGEEVSDGRYNRLAQDVASDVEIPVLMTGGENNDYFLASGDTLSIIDWTPEMDRYFVDIMLEQVYRGNRINQTFNEQAWNDMVETCSEKFGLKCDKQVLENRFVCLMRQCNDVHNLLSHGGFVWSESQQLVVAEDDVWEAFTKEHPDAIFYRGQFLGNYIDLCKICSNNVLDQRLEDQDHDQDQSMRVENAHIVTEQEMRGVSEEVRFQTEEALVPKQQIKRTTAPSLDTGRSNKVQKTGKEMQKALAEMAGAVTKLTSKKESKNYITMESAIDALQAIPGIDDELLLDACDLLEDERKAKTFLALDVNLRKKWLLRKLRPQ